MWQLLLPLANTVYAFDADNGKLFWSKKFHSPRIAGSKETLISDRIVKMGKRL
jgi:outer membrane protein assembly factor BamB